MSLNYRLESNEEEEGLRNGGMRNEEIQRRQNREAGSYLRLTDFVYHSTLGVRVIIIKIACC